MVEQVVEKRMAPVTQRVEKVVEMSATELFRSNLKQKVPDWLDRYNSLAFQEWLDKTPPLVDRTFRELISDAEKADMREGKADRVAQFFAQFEQETGANGSAAVSGRQTSASLEGQVSPPRRGTAPETRTGNSNQKVWTPGEIRDFYQRRSRGEFKNDPDGARRIEKDIFAAQGQGRIAAG